MLNADLNARVVKETEAMAWHDTAEAGEWLKPLEEDVGRATGVVKYAPGSVLSSPAGSVGEEIIVLEGVLADKHGDYATGTYLRNPPDVQRTLRRLRAVRETVWLRSERYRRGAARHCENVLAPGLVTGLSVMPLHQHQHEHAALVRWQPETYFQPHGHFGGEEILVLSGVFEDEFGRYPANTWIRSPHMSRHQPFSRSGCTIYVKTGHLMVSKTGMS